MANVDKNKSDWWGKPDHLKGEGRGRQPKPKTEKKPTESAKKSSKVMVSKGRIAGIIAGNIVMMILLGVAAACAAHLALQWVTRHDTHCEVPQFEGAIIDEAIAEAEAQGLTIIINDSLYAPKYKRGEVLYQIPEKGSVVKPGRTIYVTINATLQKMVDLPYVAGRSLRQGKNMLEAAGFTIDRLNYENDIATNYILGQNCNGRDMTELSQLKMPVGTAVTLTVGVNDYDNTTVIPSVVGRTLFAARSALWDAGLNVGKITTDEEIDPADYPLALVMKQSIPADTTVRLGREISLRLTLTQDVVDRAVKAETDERKWIDEMNKMEEQIDDIYDETVVDSTLVEPVEEKVIEEVVFEDLF